ncbi:hypothetical protein SHKM778_84770 [Streptomyces sp. KM77-8]|uniref:Uncharacterized protein n=1 Tax=Streptomyces haneummycinicus TaxID=3074435 RepID=A0AAT9HWS5_9ACTN
MGAGAEELEGERGVAVLVEAVVEEDVGGAEEDGVAVAGGGRYAQQGGEAFAGVALVGVEMGGGVADAARVGGARAAGGGQGAVGGEGGVEAGGRVGGDAGASRSTEALPAEMNTVRPPDSVVAECSRDC